MYTDLASKERAHFTAEINTPIMDHARAMKVAFSEVSLSNVISPTFLHHHYITLLSQYDTIVFALHHCSNTVSPLFHPQIKYKDQYEKMKHKYTSIHDTPILVRAKKAYLQSSDVSMLSGDPCSASTVFGL